MAAMSLREMVTRWPYPSADNHPQNWHCGTACTGNKHIFFLTSSRKPNPNLNGVLLTWGGLNTSQTQNAKNSDPKRHTQSFFIFVCAFFSKMLKPEHEIPSLKTEAFLTQFLKHPTKKGTFPTSNSSPFSTCFQPYPAFNLHQPTTLRHLHGDLRHLPH